MSSPVSATFRIVCLNAQIIESNTSLNCTGGIARRAEEKKKVLYHSAALRVQMKCLTLGLGRVHVYYLGTWPTIAQPYLEYALYVSRALYKITNWELFYESPSKNY